MSPNHLHYSWDWAGVHFAMLGIYPGTEGDCASGTGIAGGGCCNGGSRSICWGLDISLDQFSLSLRGGLTAFHAAFTAFA